MVKNAQIQKLYILYIIRKTTF